MGLVGSVLRKIKDVIHASWLRCYVELLLLLVADESTRVLFDDGNGPVIKACISWLSSGNSHLEISGCLALGNFGRSGQCLK